MAPAAKSMLLRIVNNRLVKIALVIVASSCNSRLVAEKLNPQANVRPSKVTSYCRFKKQVPVATVSLAVGLIDDSEINNSYYPYQSLRHNVRRNDGFEARYDNLNLPLSRMARDLGIRGGSVHALGVIMTDQWEGSFRPVYVEVELPRNYLKPTSWYLFSSSYRGDVCP